jgi:phosphatidylethanolamine/phosphatidyl-N-methylethanolamine N-methyltransferase
VLLALHVGLRKRGKIVLAIHLLRRQNAPGRTDMIEPVMLHRGHLLPSSRWVNAYIAIRLPLARRLLFHSWNFGRDRRFFFAERAKFMSAYGDFFKGAMRDPGGVSAPTPSSPALAAAIAAKVDPLIPGLVVELGAGSGAVTQALLARGIAPERLIAIEYSDYFATLLAQRFCGVRVVCGDAFEFEKYVPLGEPIAAIVSGLPLLNFPPRRRRALIERALVLQGVGGRFIQLSYGWRPPIVSAFGVSPGKDIVWRNFPPAHIWTFSAQTQRAAAPTGEKRDWRMAGTSLS